MMARPPSAWLAAGAIGVVLTRNGEAARTISKYRPACPVLVVSDQDWVLRYVSVHFGLYPVKVGLEAGLQHAYLTWTPTLRIAALVKGNFQCTPRLSFIPTS